MSAIRLQMEKGGNPGNAMFQYAYLKQLQSLLDDAELTGFQIPMFGLSSGRIELPGRVLRIEGGHKHSLEQLTSLFRRRIYDSLAFAGFVQRLEFYPDRAAFASHFPCPDHLEFPRLSRAELLINVRGHEILTSLHPDYGPVPVAYYRRIAEQSGLEPVIMGQLGDDAYSEALRRSFAGCKFLPHVSPVIDFETIRHAVNIAASVSTFSWLAAWLSETAEAVHMPLKGFMHPRQRSDVDLVPVGDARYQFYLFPVERWKATEEQLQALTSSEGGFEWRSHADVRELIQY